MRRPREILPTLLLNAAVHSPGTDSGLRTLSEVELHPGAQRDIAPLPVGARRSNFVREGDAIVKSRAISSLD